MNGPQEQRRKGQLRGVRAEELQAGDSDDHEDPVSDHENWQPDIVS